MMARMSGTFRNQGILWSMRKRGNTSPTKTGQKNTRNDFTINSIQLVAPPKKRLTIKIDSLTYRIARLVCNSPRNVEWNSVGGPIGISCGASTTSNGGRIIEPRKESMAAATAIGLVNRVQFPTPPCWAATISVIENSSSTVARKTGARGLRTILENVLLNSMYELPSLESVSKVVVDESVIECEAEPFVVYENHAKAAGASE